MLPWKNHLSCIKSERYEALYQVLIQYNADENRIELYILQFLDRT